MSDTHATPEQRDSQRRRCLLAYLEIGPTDDSRIGEHIGLRQQDDSSYWSRCSELRSMGLTEWLRDENGKRILQNSLIDSSRGVAGLTEEGRPFAEAMRDNPNLPWPRF